jgi:hypothetical protein
VAARAGTAPEKPSQPERVVKPNQRGAQGHGGASGGEWPG